MERLSKDRHSHEILVEAYIIANPAYHAGLFGLDCKSCHNTGAWLPAQFNRPHGFDMNHEGAGSCRDCHPTSLATVSCVKCHPGGAPKEGGGGN